MKNANSVPQSNPGAELLDRVRSALTRYVILPSDPAADAVVLWIAATHGLKFWTHAARLVIRAPEKRCGKSRLLDIVEALCWNALLTVNASPAAVYRSIGSDDPPTLLIDEADTIFGPAAAGANEDLRGLLNAGHQRNRPTIRYDASKSKVEKIQTFTMAALAGIGAMPDTIEDRAAVIRMRRRADGESVAPYRERRDGPALRKLAAELNKWIRSHPELQHAEPPMPVEDRAADTWEALVAVADLAGGTWPERARAACVDLTTEREANADQPLQVRLLADIRTAFEGDDALATATLLARLNLDEEAPWIDYGPRGESLTATQLAKLLREYDIRVKNIRFANGHQAKGYSQAMFTDAWARYCPQTPTDAEPEIQAQGPLWEPSQPSQPSPPWSEQPRSRPTAVPHAVPETSQPSHTPTVSNGPAGPLGRPDPTPGTASGTANADAAPPVTSNGTAGTTGTASQDMPPATCIRCREPMTYDDGTRTHPNCA
ncbi:DUF3631 domain-containing protein [Kineosporia sp. NBRC 101731]|uniref:DUF3631 domain-containing protein n=1 Tax=Kineosporia sp. NBRC 101731 TaxID=3032199 RepID=UPI0024A421EF|nr:DUF3631 domain-containing protein [Kineosporia sp. NBRC 101731]GLY32418.1 hypothetical protein Kisp02_57830 [Kineosporia sp. NBRC 101731]